MKLRTAAHFDRAYATAPNEIQAAFQKQALFLIENLRHLSLHAKEHNEAENLWKLIPGS
jgi:hypothetical protein